MAMARYIARKANLQGDTEADFALSEMLIEEQNDIYNLVADAHYAQDKVVFPLEMDDEKALIQ